MTNQPQIESTLPLLQKHRVGHPDGKPIHDDHQGKQTSSRLGQFYLLLCAIFFGFHSVLIRVAETTFAVPLGLTLYIRALIHVIGSIVFFVFSYRPSELFTWTLPRKQAILLLFRGLSGTLSLLMFYIAVKMINVGDAVSVFFLNPIFTFLLAGLFLSETVTMQGVIAIFLSAIGTILIAVGQNHDVEDSVMLTTRIIGLVIMAVCAFLASVAYTIIRTLGMSICFMSSVLTFACFCFFISFFFNDFEVLPLAKITALPVEGLIAAIAAGITSFVAQCFLNLGLQRCKAGPGMLINNVEVPIVFLLGAVFLHEYPNAISICGSALIVSAAIVIGLEKINRHGGET